MTALLPLIPQPLTPEGFAPFGQVASAGSGRALPVNEGRGIRYDGDCLFESAGQVTPVLAVYRIQPSSLPFTVREMEQHPSSSQAFIPMSAGRFLVVAALADASGGPDPATAAAFEASPGQIVNYGRGVWHCPLVALDHPGDFAMVMWQEADPALDCRVVTLGTPLTVERQPSSQLEFTP